MNIAQFLSIPVVVVAVYMTRGQSYITQFIAASVTWVIMPRVYYALAIINIL